MSNKMYPFDARLEHRAVASAAQTATAVVATVEQRVAMRTDYMTRIGLESIAIDGNDELYTFVVEVSNDDFTTIAVAAMADFGATETRQSGAVDSVVGDFVDLEWSTEVGGVKYQDWRLKCFHAGSTSSIGYFAHSSVR